MPGINDDARQVTEIIDRAYEAGAESVGGITLHLRGEVRDVFMGWLREKRPDLVPRYEEIYRRGAYAPAEVKRATEAPLRRAGHVPRRYLRGIADAEGDAPREEAVRQPALF